MSDALDIRGQTSLTLTTNVLSELPSRMFILNNLGSLSACSPGGQAGSNLP
jgi:hypothetical protein